MRKLTVKIPRLPVVAAPDAVDPTPSGEFGPISWAWASQGDNGDAPENVSVPDGDALHVRAFNFAVAICPGAIDWRLDPDTTSDYQLFANLGCVVVYANGLAPASCDLYAIDAGGLYRCFMARHLAGLLAVACHVLS